MSEIVNCNLQSITADDCDDVGCFRYRLPASKKQLSANRTVFTVSGPDCYAIVDDKPSKIVDFDDSSVTYRVFVDASDFFTHDIPSSQLYIFSVSSLSDYVTTSPITSVLYYQKKQTWAQPLIFLSSLYITITSFITKQCVKFPGLALPRTTSCFRNTPRFPSAFTV
ncbi:hypothetical protein AHF37_01610 [Paragonimus kellicotti]|nr:hypothetical protein AHF37_01610 [Paragonimus kellicotti]